MKTLFIFLASFLLACTSTGNQTSNGVNTETFFVAGECSMCKTRIEKTTLKQPGVETASWNKETKQLTVVFDPAKISVIAIQKAIAAVGHDTPTEQAPDSVYSKLPHCCHYPRQQTTKGQ
ncbi:MAG: cation transporter [Bacteroidetes bacterium]|nr:cation transporter [Bacteroidota bacterium]